MKLSTILEKHLISGRQYLYHWTDLHCLLGILNRKVIAYFEKDKWTPSDGYKNAKPTSRSISFTRNKNYAIRGKGVNGGVRITYDWDKLRHFTKTKPVAELVGKPGGDYHEVLQGADRRYEAEETVKGPIPLTEKAGLVSIEISKEVKALINKTIKDQENIIEELSNRLKQIKTRRPTPKDYKLIKGDNFDEDVCQELIDKGKFEDKSWNPLWWNFDLISKNIKSHENIVNEYRELLKITIDMKE